LGLQRDEKSPDGQLAAPHYGGAPRPTSPAMRALHSSYVSICGGRSTHISGAASLPVTCIDIDGLPHAPSKIELAAATMAASLASGLRMILNSASTASPACLIRCCLASVLMWLGVPFTRPPTLW